MQYILKFCIQIFNATEELEASAGYNDIRFTVLKKVTSDVEEEDIEPQVKPSLHNDGENSLSHHYHRSVSFDTVNTNYFIEMYFLKHSLHWDGLGKTSF